MTHCASERAFPSPGLGWAAPEPVRVDLHTPRLHIRAYRLEDAPEVFEVINNSRDHLLPWMPWAREHRQIAFTTRYIADQVLALSAGPSFNSIGVGIFEKPGGAFVGGTGVHDIRRDTASCEIGYWVRPDQRGKGYAAEACRHILSWTFTDQAQGGLGLRRVRIYCSGANTPSQRIPAKLGLTKEVHQRLDYCLDTLGPTDRLGWGVMAHEWDAAEHRLNRTPE